MQILGIDPGYAIVGFGVVDYVRSRFSLVEYGAVTTDAGTPMDRRIELVYDGVSALMDKYPALSALSVEQLFFTTNQKTAIAVAEARGAILLAARKHGLPIYEYTPLQVKSAVVGYGKADKAQVMEMTRRLLRLDAVPRPDDAADALAMAICHGHTGSSALNKLLLEEKLR